jgi:hypothetical protein
VRIRKMTMPTKSESPATNCPKAMMTWPATPASSGVVGVGGPRMRRVDATLSTRRKSVVASRSDGKTLKSSGWSM